MNVTVPVVALVVFDHVNGIFVVPRFTVTVKVFAAVVGRLDIVVVTVSPFCAVVTLPR